MPALRCVALLDDLPVYGLEFCMPHLVLNGRMMGWIGSGAMDGWIAILWPSGALVDDGRDGWSRARFWTDGWIGLHGRW